MITQQLIVNIVLILAVAWILGNVFVRLGLPVFLGELLAGLILGPPLLGVVEASEAIELMAEFGIFFLMFYAGMEMDPNELLEHITPSILVAVGGFVLPFVMGFGTSWAFGGTLYQSLFIGMGLSITSLAVQARILHDMQIQQTSLGHIIIGAAIADDILALITLSVLLGLAQSGTIDLANVAVILIKVTAFFGAAILVSNFVMPRLIKNVDLKGSRGFTFSLVTALVMAYLAELAGLHLVIGAFVAGQFVRKELTDVEAFERISDRFYGLTYGFLAPIFFASLSFHLEFDWGMSMVVLTVLITVVAIVGKVVGCAAGAVAYGRGYLESSVVGFGMNGRGAVELIVAVVVIKLSEGLLESGTIAEPLLTQDQFSALVTMAFVTTLLAPITMKWAMKKACSIDEHAEFCMLWEKGKKRFR